MSREVESSSAAPAAEAFASLAAPDTPRASKVIAPPELSERPVVALTECSARVKPIEKPTAAPLALAEPVALAEALADCSACTVSVPVVVSGARPRPMAALVSTIEMATATTGVIASPPAPVVFAPFSASTIDWCPPVAETSRLCAPVSVARSPIEALVVSMTTDTAIERPRPNFAPVAPAESAFVVET